MSSAHPPGGQDRPDHDGSGLREAEAFLNEDAPRSSSRSSSASGGPSGSPGGGGGVPSPPPPPPATNTVDHVTFEARLYSEIFEASEELAALPEHDAAPPTMPELLEDFFFGFFKLKPRVLDARELSEEHARVNRPLVEKLLEDGRTAILRLSTALDDMASALAALEAGRNVIEEIENRPELASWVQPPPPPAKPDVDEPQPRSHPEPQPPPQPPQRDLRRMLRGSLEAAQEAVDGYGAALSGWGLSPGGLKRVPLSDRLEIARRLRSPRLADFARLLGRMRDAATSAAATGLASGTDDVHSVTTGGPLERVLPQELASGLASGEPTLEANFYRKLAEGSLLSYELTSPEHQGSGPIVAMIDSSPSMAGPPMDWASALAAALAQGPAAKEGRPVHLVYFNTGVVKEVRLDPYEKDPRKLLEIATVGTSGGTDFDAPLLRALEVVSDDEAYEKADLILVTDGHCRLSEKAAAVLEEAREKTDFSLYAVLCGAGASAADVGRYATAVYHAEHDLVGTASGDRAATDIFRNF